MAPFVPRSANQIANSMLARLVARSALTDMIATDDTYVLLMAVATEIANIEYRAWTYRQSFNITNPDLSDEEFELRAAELPGGKFARKPASTASGSVMSVTRLDNTETQTLPAGSTFARVDGSDMLYRTVYDSVFNPGTVTLTNIYVECTQPGPSGNCATGVIAVATDAPDWVVSCYNAGDLVNGASAETLQAAQSRIVKYLSALNGSQKTALEYLAESFVSSGGVQAQKAIAMYDPATPKYATLLVDAGESLSATAVVPAMSGVVPYGGQTMIAHPGPATGPLSLRVTRVNGLVETLTEEAGQIVSLYEQGYIYVPFGKPWSLNAGDTWAIDQFDIWVGFISELQMMVCGDVNDPVNLPGWQALGCRVIVRPPDIVWVPMDIHVVPVNGVDLDTVKVAVQMVAIAFLRTLGPGDPLYVSQLVASICQLPIVLDAKVFEHNVTPLLPMSDRYPSKVQALRTSYDIIQFITSVGT